MADDRLNRLPDGVLDHIVSFLDTKSAVRTSLLSSSWRSRWMHVPALNFLPDTFHGLSSFTAHVINLFSLRSNRIPLSSITFDARERERLRVAEIKKALGKTLKSAAAGSHRGGGGGGLRYLSACFPADDRLQFETRDVADAITAASDGHHESLETLKLVCCTVETEFGSPFHSLTRLELRGCPMKQLYDDHKLRGGDPIFDPFAGLPCLKHLKLYNCYVLHHPTWLVISGRELRVLEIEHDRAVHEVVAPKLESLYWHGVGVHRCLPRLILPALRRANVRLAWHDTYGVEKLEEERRGFLSFLRGLVNAECLQLRLDKGKRYFGCQLSFPLDAINKAVIEHEAPPFTRLKTLRIQCAGRRLQKLPNIPVEVIRYFFESSLNREEKFFQLELLQVADDDDDNSSVAVLDRANIRFYWRKPADDDEAAALAGENGTFSDFLVTLRNAESAKLRFFN